MPRAKVVGFPDFAKMLRSKFAQQDPLATMLQTRLGLHELF